MKGGGQEEGKSSKGEGPSWAKVIVKQGIKILERMCSLKSYAKGQGTGEEGKRADLFSEGARHYLG